MTLFCGFLAPERVVIGADTQASEPDETGRLCVDGRHVSKLVTVPHLHAVVVCRGAVEMARVVQSALLNIGSDDLELVATGLGIFLEPYRDMKPSPEDLAIDPEGAEALAGWNVLLVGYDPKLEVCGAWLFASGEHGAKIWGQRFQRGPLLGSSDQLSDAETVLVTRLAHSEPSIDSVTAIAALQYEKLTDDQRRIGFGGHLTIADIDATGIRLELRRDFFAEA